MTVYEVTVDVEARLTESFEQYMRGKHIPEILATGCFTAIHFEKAAPARFRTRYEAPSRTELDNYLSEHTARFREDFMTHFPIGCTVRREVWEEVECFTAPQ
ncbi:MAG: DUF4286 family protein [Holophagaceae bacterium]|nr:DUF4286 family protein [Holophagaceae bacterium]